MAAVSRVRWPLHIDRAARCGYAHRTTTGLAALSRALSMSEKREPVVDVSVLTPSLNYGRFIEDALQSALHQQGLSVQHIVQDGASTDDTLEVLSRFDANVDWTSEPDRGQSDALNKAMSRATGRWVGWLNADEFYLPGSLAHLIRAGEESGADVVYGDCAFVDESGRLLRLLAQHRFSPRVLREYGCYISSNSAIFRRSVLGKDPWDEELHKMMDWDLFMNLVLHDATVLYVPYPVGAFRMHPAQVTASPRDWSSEYGDDDFPLCARQGHRPPEATAQEGPLAPPGSEARCWFLPTAVARQGTPRQGYPLVPFFPRVLELDRTPRTLLWVAFGRVWAPLVSDSKRVAGCFHHGSELPSRSSRVSEWLQRRSGSGFADGRGSQRAQSTQCAPSADGDDVPRMVA